VERLRTFARTLAALLVLSLVAAAVVACAGADQPGGTGDVVATVPFGAGERAVYALHDNSGEIVARGILAISAGLLGLVLDQSYRSVGDPADAEPADRTAVTVDAATLKPFALARTTVDGDRVDDYRSRYEVDAATGLAATVTITSDRDGKHDERELKLHDHYYDNESSLWLWRALGLVDGYEARYVSVNHLDRSQQSVSLRVIDRQTVEVPAGTFEAWRLQVRNGRATRIAWINVDPPHQLVQWDNGTLVFRLETFEPASP
jgi:hypothetical protein